MRRMTRRLISALVLLAAACGNGSNNNTPPDGGFNTCPVNQSKFMDVCVTMPTLEAKRTQCADVTEFCDDKGTVAPALACLTDPPRQHPATPDKVTLTGYVHPFSSGRSNSTVTIQVYRAADLLGQKDASQVQPVVPAVAVDFNPATATDPTQFRACDADAHVGCVPTTPSACTAPTCNDGLNGRGDENKYCRLENNSPQCNERLRWEPRFAIPNVPTNTPLVIRTTGKNAQADQVWAVMWQWNAFLATDDKTCANSESVDCIDNSGQTPKYQLNVNVLSQSDYTAIPVTSGLAGGISNGLAAVAGEIHDCDNVRIGSAQVGVAPAGDRFTYFNGNPYNTLPDSSRAGTGTDRLGLYAALNVPPGKVLVQAVGLVAGQPTLLGQYTAQVYANSVAVVNLNGGKPVQQP